MRDHEDELRRAGASLAAVGLADRTYAAAFREETGIRFPLLVDEERRAYRAARLRKAPIFHVLRRDNARARARAKAAGHRQHRLGSDPLQLGATFLFGPGDTDLYVHRSATFGDNAPTEDLLRAVAERGGRLPSSRRAPGAPSA